MAPVCMAVCKVARQDDNDLEDAHHSLARGRALRVGHAINPLLDPQFAGPFWFQFGSAPFVCSEAAFGLTNLALAQNCLSSLSGNKKDLISKESLIKAFKDKKGNYAEYIKGICESN